MYNHLNKITGHCSLFSIRHYVSLCVSVFHYIYIYIYISTNNLIYIDECKDNYNIINTVTNCFLLCEMFNQLLLLYPTFTSSLCISINKYFQQFRE